MRLFTCMHAQEVFFFSNKIYKKPVTFLKMVVKKLFEMHYSLKKLSASPKNGNPPNKKIMVPSLSKSQTKTTFWVKSPCINYVQYERGCAVRTRHIFITSDDVQYESDRLSVQVRICSTSEAPSVRVRMCSTNQAHHQCKRGCAVQARHLQYEQGCAAQTSWSSNFGTGGHYSKILTNE